MWRWLFADQEGAFATHERRHMCPRCRMYFPPWADGKNSKKIFQKNKPAPGKNADVLLNMGCPRGAPAVASAGVNLTNQILIGGCGESQDGTGAAYAKYGHQHYPTIVAFMTWRMVPHSRPHMHICICPQTASLAIQNSGMLQIWQGRCSLRPPFGIKVCTMPLSSIMTVVDRAEEEGFSRPPPKKKVMPK